MIHFCVLEQVARVSSVVQLYLDPFDLPNYYEREKEQQFFLN